MKTKLIAGVMLMASASAHADAWFARNKSGGEIVITDAVCYMGGQQINELRQGFARTNGGSTIYGCWYYADRMVHMVYEDKTRYVYPVEGFYKLESY